MKLKNINIFLKKCWFTLALLLLNMAAYAQACFPGDVGCDIDAPLDTHLWVLIGVVLLLSLVTLAKRKPKIN